MREPTRLNPIPAVVERARALFSSDATRPLAARLQRLAALDAAVRKHEALLFAALKQDLGKGLHEAYATEIGQVYQDLRHASSHLGKWVRPTRLPSPLMLWPSSSWQYPEPLGTALIIGAWNYPVQLALLPLIGSIAAGGTAVIKPSEQAPATADAIEQVVAEAFGHDGFCTVVQGGPEVSTALLAEAWDTIFFTGSTRIGQVVAEAAAKHLTPCVLELGGKSPCLVDEKVDLPTAARRIAWGKFNNAGQTCIAPDYVLAHKARAADLVTELQRAVRELYGEHPRQSADYGRIVNARHFDRLKALMAGGRVAFGGEADPAERFIAPTVLTHVELSHPLMQEEIFGPLLPVIEVDNLEDATRFVRSRPRPLALYVFSSDSAASERVLRTTSSGGALVNDTLLQVASTELPFGGVGPSGTGRYHGRASFEAFSHLKSVMKKPFRFDIKLRYPPYRTSLAMLRRVLR